MTCKECKKECKKLGYSTTIRWLAGDQFMTKELTTFHDLCDKCSRSKVLDWKIINGVSKNSFPSEFWIQLFPDHKDQIKLRHFGKGTLNHYLANGKSKEDWLEKNSKLSVGEDKLRRSGKSEEEIMSIKFNHSSKSAITEDNFIRKYGNVDGVVLYKKAIENIIKTNPRRLSFYLEAGFSLEDAKEKLRRVQSRDLSYFIDKYGADAGKAIWENYCKIRGCTKEQLLEKYGEDKTEKILKSKGRTLENLIVEYGEELGMEINSRRTAHIHSRSSTSNSNIQKEFALALYSKLDKEKQSRFYGVPITENSFLISLIVEDILRVGQKIIVPDIRLSNLIIEFDGVYWHSFSKDRDLKKDEYLKRIGFYVIRVLEEDYKKDKIKCIEDTIRLINANYDNSFHFRKEIKI